MRFTDCQRWVRYFNDKYHIEWCFLRSWKPREYSIIIPHPDGDVILEISHMTHRAFRDADSFIRDTIREENQK